MIKYQLGCTCGHEFEAWFASSTAFSEQKRRGLLNCPACASHEVEKRPMAPAIMKGRSSAPHQEKRAAEPADAEADLTRESKAFADAAREMRAHIASKSENVGTRFAEEARRIHFGESEERPIHGEATLQDAVDLEEDGVTFGILPPLPEEKN
jgi:hypothetical protein